MIRQPVMAGHFYEENPKKLEKQIINCFESKFGPGVLPSKRKNKRIVGVIAPHAGYVFSGPCAVWAYKEIAEAEFPEVYIMLGLSHSGKKSCISLSDWETPLGIVKNDTEFGKLIMKNAGLKNDEQTHLGEHSIEVQLPFLQFASKDRIKDLRICPIIISPGTPYEEIAKGIDKTINQTGKNAVIIASSDFTHYGLNYGFFPFTENIKENMKKFDAKAIEHIKNLDDKGFLKYVFDNDATICGAYPIAALLSLAKYFDAKKAILQHYYTSGDIINDYSSAVGYASIILE